MIDIFIMIIIVTLILAINAIIFVLLDNHERKNHEERANVEDGKALCEEKHWLPLRGIRGDFDEKRK